MEKEKILLDKKKKKKILTASIGQCVHVAGAYNFIQIAKQLNFDCYFLGPATPNLKIIEKVKELHPDIVGLSYRLTPETVKPILTKFFKEYNQLEDKPKYLLFAGTAEVVDIAKRFSEFNHFFVGGESRYEILSILKKSEVKSNQSNQIPMDLINRIKWKKPFPIIRAHFGLPNLDDTINGIKRISDAKILDVISIAPDQNTQANYYHLEDIDEELSGAGGVPLSSRKDFIKLHKARLRGNYPMLRIYAGTRDFIKLGQLYLDTIKNAWAAIPIFWFNQMDGRGPLSLKVSIKRHLEAIKWHANQNIPVEINDAHHWSLRNAPDAIAVADMYLCGIIAKNLGVKHFIAQYMFNTPSSLSLDMDLAKMLAKNELLQTLVDDNFEVIKQVRTGLASFPLDLSKAKGQLAVATMIQLALQPDIIHVVSYSEADHAALPEDIIQSCKIVDQVINQYSQSKLRYINNAIIERKNQLIKEAKLIINLIPNLVKNTDEAHNPYIHYKVLNRLVKYGIFDAPHLKSNKFALGEIETRIINGACYSWNSIQNKVYEEINRIEEIDERIPELDLLNLKNFKRNLISTVID
ncbi:MAG: methionine synthase [Candidatus Hermodarchaeota archaeon]